MAGAVVGSLALSDGDRWSDLDLTFSVADDCPVLEVLEDWTGNIVRTFNAARLFTLPVFDAAYRPIMAGDLMICLPMFTASTGRPLQLN